MGLIVVLAVGSQVLAGALTSDVDPERLLGAAFQPLVSLAVARWRGADPHVQKALTARAITRPRIATDRTDWMPMASFAHETRGITSVGLKARALVKPR